MTKERLLELAEMIPVSSEFFDLHVSRDRDASRQQLLIDRQTVCLSDPKFGWHFIKSFVESDQDLPNCAAGEDYLQRAYVFEKELFPDPAIAGAISLDHPASRHHRGILRAFLITKTAFPEIEEQIGIPLDVIQAYETLFFNVRDRLNDRLYIANLVYPDGKIIETLPDYNTREDVYMLLLRSAFNNGVVDMTVISGITPDNMGARDSFVSATQFEAYTMGYAALMIKNGMWNQRMPVMSGARGMISASKMAGQENKPAEQIGLASIGGVIMDDLHKIAGPLVAAQMEERKRQEAERPKAV